MKTFSFYPLMTLFLLLSCGSETTPKDHANLTFEIQKNEASSMDLSEGFSSPAFSSYFGISSITSPSQFSCIFLNVTGPNIPPKGNSTDDGPNSLRYAETLSMGKPCAYEGVTSRPIPNQSGSSVSVSVPTGIKRLIQVMGITNGLTCPSEFTAGDIIRQIESSNGGHLTGLYELGRTVADVMDDKTVGVANQLNSTNAYLKNNDVCNYGYKISASHVKYGKSTSYDTSYSNSTYSLPMENWTDAYASSYGLNYTGTASSLSDGQINSSVVLSGLTSSLIGRMDILFPIFTLPLTLKPRLKISFSCAASTTVSFNLYNKNGGSPGWGTKADFFTSAGGIHYYTHDFGVSPNNFTFAELSTPVTNTSSETAISYIYVSVRAPTNCGTLTVYDSFLEYY